MNLEVAPFAPEEKHVLVNLWPLYLYDLAEFDGALPSSQGLFEDEDVCTLGHYETSLAAWWEKPGLLMPFLFRVGGRAAGFALVGACPGYAPKGRDYYLHEFFVLRPFRARGFGERAAGTVFGRLPGAWELRAMGNNPRALGFWRKTLRSYAADGVFEQSPDKDRVVFRFDIREPVPGSLAVGVVS